MGPSTSSGGEGGPSARPSIVHREPANDFSDSQRAVHLYLCTGDQGVHSVISA